MRPPGWIGTLLLAGLLVLAGLTAGLLLRAPGSLAPSGGPRTLSITAAGTLDPLFPQVGQALANATPGVSAPRAAQVYEGSLAALASVSELHQPFDVAAAADFRLIPGMLEPTYASWEVVFASTPEVLVYDPSLAALASINGTNWPDKLTLPNVILGVANQSTDPNGYNAIFVLELEGALRAGSLSSLYAHFFTTPVGALAEPNPTTTRVEPETAVATLIATHVVSAFITYRSYAVSHGLSFVPLDDQVGLGSTAPADLTYYAQASTTILSGSGPRVVTGAPVLFAATVPSNAPDPDLGAAFIDYLLSPAGSALLSTDGFAPVVPGFADTTSTLPPILVPDTIPLPAALGSLLP